MKRWFLAFGMSFLLITIGISQALFEPPEGKKLLILGQDMGAIGGFSAPNNDGYVDNIPLVPGGTTTYTSINNLEGLVSLVNYGSGDVCARCILQNETYSNSVLAIGLYMVGILDEINNARHLKLVDTGQVIELIKSRPDKMHLVLTGRDAHPDVIDLADTVSEVNEIKHAYRKDIEPQPGIDF